MDEDVQRLNVSRRLSYGNGSAIEQEDGPTVVTNHNHNNNYEIINHLKISNNNNNVNNHKFSSSSPSPPPLPTSLPPSHRQSTLLLSDPVKLTARAEPNNESSLPQLNDSSSSTLKTSGLSSPSSLEDSSSSSLASPPSTSTPKSRKESARFHVNATPPDDSSFTSGASAKFKSSSDNSKRRVKNGTVPHLTFSPETPPILSSSSLNEFPTSSTRSTSAFADLGKMKATPGTSRKSALLSSHVDGLADVDMNVSSSSGAGLSQNGHAGNMNSILSENSNVNHSHSSSNISSTEENFECLGEGPESFLDSHSEHNSLQFSRDVNDSSSLSIPGDGPVAPAPLIRRNSWLRTSLRKSPQQQPGSSPNGDTMGHRRWGSFRNSSGSKRPAVTSSSALANQLYRSSSFHSSGRSSAGDGEEMYSDGSLEDEVIDLTQKVHHLEEKFSVLAENQTDVDDRYVRIKQENTELSTKLFMAEESLRDVEQRAEEKLRDEQKRFKDVLARAEREKQLHIENYDIRLRSCEKDTEQAKSEVARLKQKLDRERTEKTLTSDKLLETERELTNLREDHRALTEALRKERDAYLLESKASQQALVELRKEVESMRKQRDDIPFSSSEIRPGHTRRFNSVESESEAAELKSRLTELEEENKHFKQQNKQLQEANDELSAQILNHGLEEGRHLLTVNRNMGDIGNSLAAEFEAMSQDQLKKALKEQTEVNDQLRTYIDGILLNIVENYPQLLEVKNKSSPENSLDQRC